MINARAGWRVWMIWGGVGLALLVPAGIAATSPYLPSRSAAYIVAGFAGIVALWLMLVQPLLAALWLPGGAPAQARRWHLRAGMALIGAVFLHIGGLYLTSPPDTVDALLLRSPTPFSVFGVIATWGLVLTGLLVSFRRRWRLRYPLWHMLHNWVALAVVTATVVHAMQIEGTMGPTSKLLLCVLVVLGTLWSLWDVRVVRQRRKSR